MKRIGLLALALVLALGALGVGYAAWWDDAEIVQVVETGDLELGVFGEAFLDGDLKDEVTLSVVNEGLKFSKDVYPFDFYQSVPVTVGNLYPSVTVAEDFYIGAGGTVPMHLDVTLTFDGDPLVYECMDIGWVIYWPDGTTTSGGDQGDLALAAIVAELQDFQIHGCETIKIWLDKHLRQCEGRNQGLSGSSP